MICYVIMEPLAGTIGAGLVGTIYLYSGHLVATGVQIQGLSYLSHNVSHFRNNHLMFFSKFDLCFWVLTFSFRTPNLEGCLGYTRRWLDFAVYRPRSLWGKSSGAPWQPGSSAPHRSALCAPRSDVLLGLSKGILRETDEAGRDRYQGVQEQTEEGKINRWNPVKVFEMHYCAKTCLEHVKNRNWKRCFPG